MFPENPAYEGRLPSISSDFWDPLWAACCENSMVVWNHIGTAMQPPITSPDESVWAWAASLPLATGFSLGDWLFAPMWKKFPSLRGALAEASTGWVPFLLEHADYAYLQHRELSGMDLGGVMPSDIFRQHFLLCFISDRFGIANHEYLGIDNIIWECDYPHADCTWPHSPETAWDSVKNLTDEQVNKVTHLNVMRDLALVHFSLFRGKTRR